MRTQLLATAILFAAAAAQAADAPKKEAGFGGGKATGAFLTRDELRACMAQQARVAQQDGEMQKEQAALGETRAAIERSGEELKDQLNAVDRSSAAAVASYNDRAQARERQIDDYQARVTAFNTRLDALKAEREAFVKGCENRRYLDEDEAAIKKGR